MALTVGNFKAFKDVQRLPLKPITLIYGPNSAGKSTLVQAIAFAHQAEFGFGSTERPSLDIHHTAIGGSAVDLGGFRQYVHCGKASLRVLWGAEVEASALDDVNEWLKERLTHVKRLTLNLSIGIDVDDRDRPRAGAEPRVEKIDLLADGEELIRMSRRPPTEGQDPQINRFRVDWLAVKHPLFGQLHLDASSRSGLSEASGKDVEGSVAEAVSEIVTTLIVEIDGFLPGDARVSIPPVRSMNLPKVPVLELLEQTVPDAIQSLLVGIGRALREQIGTLRYLGPLRSLPPRNLSSTQQGDLNRVAGGSWAWDELRENAKVRDAVNSWLGSKRLDTPYELQVRSLASVDSIVDAIDDVLTHAHYEGSASAVELSLLQGEPVINYTGDLATRLASAIADSRLERFRELVLLDKRRNAVVTHRDVGVGISQVLPVLVLCYGSKGRTIAIEQPEIHLHPRLQAELGDVFIESALSERGNTLLIETHSEHLLLRLQRRIREDRLKPPAGRPSITSKDIAVFYVEPYEGRSVVREMPLTETGELAKAWPNGFFEEGLREQLDA